MTPYHPDDLLSVVLARCPSDRDRRLIALAIAERVGRAVWAARVERAVVKRHEAGVAADWSEAS